VERLHMSAPCRESGLGRHQGVNVSLQQDMEAVGLSTMLITKNNPVLKPLLVTITQMMSTVIKKMCLFILIYSNTIFAVFTIKCSHNVPVSVTMPFCLSVHIKTSDFQAILYQGVLHKYCKLGIAAFWEVIL
jgi:hypothetical protein